MKNKNLSFAISAVVMASTMIVNGSTARARKSFRKPKLTSSFPLRRDSVIPPCPSYTAPAL